MDAHGGRDAEQPHDILAAEAFAVGMGDAELHREPAHDVLAADAFPLPAPHPHAVPPEWQTASGASAGTRGPATQPSRSRPSAWAVTAALVTGTILFVAVRRSRRLSDGGAAASGR